MSFVLFWCVVGHWGSRELYPAQGLVMANRIGIQRSFSLMLICVGDVAPILHNWSEYLSLHCGHR